LSKFYHIPESIECTAANIVAKKIIPTALINEEGIGRCQKYKCSRDSYSTIKKELVPLEPIKEKTSKLKLGDRLEAENIYFLTKGFKKLKVTKIKKSGRHNSQEVNTSVYTYAEITKPFEHIMKAIGKMEVAALKAKTKELK